MRLSVPLVLKWRRMGFCSSPMRRRNRNTGETKKRFPGQNV
jgi:hypothetical protein